ncbi:4-(cytidine 5'-diphospho)-2-C-methyl-D-erythritol kinase [bacterium]|nr:4-(cytidine 5'-diphospho)-2-C-methyl-D-erythritol kinase [bacterium]
MRTARVQCPAKINLNLKVLDKRPDGYHNIESVMQTIDLFDYLTVSMIESEKNEITLAGESKDIPYDKTNLVYTAIKSYLENYCEKPKKVLVYFEKNIPVSAGLAGGSTDAAGALYAFNEMMDKKISSEELHKLCATLGSDLNACLLGGCITASGRGERVRKRLYNEYDISLIKPVNLGISAKEAYTKFSKKAASGFYNDTRKNYVNDLEWAVIDDYKELQYIKEKYPSAIMTGSGSTYFSLEEDFDPEEGYWVKNGLQTITYGVKIV